MIGDREARISNRHITNIEKRLLAFNFRSRLECKVDQEFLGGLRGSMVHGDIEVVLRPCSAAYKGDGRAQE
jgi:hypothetical protein